MAVCAVSPKLVICHGNAKCVDRVYQMPQIEVGETAPALTESAIDLIGERGLQGLATRAVAERAGVSAALVNYRFGSRAGLVGAALAHVHARDQAAWEQRRSQLAETDLTGGRFKPLLHAALSDDMRSGRRMAAARWACLVETGRSGEHAGVSEGFVNAAGGFWSEALQRAGADPAMGAPLACALISLGQAWIISEPDFRVDAWLFDVLDRIADRATGAAPGRLGDSIWRARMEAAGEAAFAQPEAVGGTRAAIVNAAAALIVERGVDAVTHRAVAEAAGVSLSSTTHHFQSVGDILTEACRTMSRRARARSVTATGPVRNYSIGELRAGLKASFIEGGGETRAEVAAMHEIMLAISRAPAVRPIAVALLAQSGRTSTHMLTSLAGERPTDRIDGQILTHLLTGLIMRLPAIATASGKEAAIDGTLDAVETFWLK